MLVNASAQSSLPISVDSQVGLRPDVPSVLETCGATLGCMADNIINCVPGVGRLNRIVNQSFATENKKQAHLIKLVRMLEDTLKAVLQESKITNSKDKKAQLEGVSKETLAEALKDIAKEYFVYEDIEFLTPAGSNTAPEGRDVSDQLSSASEAPVNNIDSVETSPQANGSNSSISELEEELRILLDILEAISFNKLDDLQEKHWIKLDSLLLKPKSPAQPRAENSESSESELQASNQAAKLPDAESQPRLKQPDPNIVS